MCADFKVRLSLHSWTGGWFSNSLLFSSAKESCVIEKEVQSSPTGCCHIYFKQS